MANNWYEIVTDESLEQGDIIERVKVVKPTASFLNGETNVVDIEENDVIILTQSCDLANKKTPWIHVTPVFPLSFQKTVVKSFNDLANLESIRRGYQHKYHMIAECDIPGHNRELSILDFRNVYTVPYNYLTNLVKDGNPRRRLLSPYKEHFAQAYARFYMRVGLPNDIPKFV